MTYRTTDEQYQVDLIALDGEDFHSSNIDILGYDRESETLYVEFQSSTNVYAYSGVKESTYEMLVNADSVGSFYAKHIKNKFDGDLVGDGDITLHESVENTEPEAVEFKIGDRVLIDFDDKFNLSAGPVWDGPGTVVGERYSDYDFIIVKTDDDGRVQSNTTGGFSANDLSLLDNGGEQGDKKWLSTDGDESPFAQSDESDGFVDSLLVEPSRYGVKWVSREVPTGGPFEPTYAALSEADALAQFNAHIDRVFGHEFHVKIVSVTHYFD